MKASTILLLVLHLIRILQNNLIDCEEHPKCIFRKDGYDDFEPKGCFYLSKIFSNKSHVLIPTTMEYFCYAPVRFENATTLCIDAEEMTFTCLSVVKQNNGSLCCFLVTEGNEYFEPRQCYYNSLTANGYLNSLVPISSRYYCKVPSLFADVQPDCDIQYDLRKLRFKTGRTSKAGHLHCTLEQLDILPPWDAHNCYYIGELMSNDTHALIRSRYGKYCFVPKIYKYSQIDCIKDTSNCKSVIKTKSVCCVYVQSGYPNYEPIECLDGRLLTAANETTILKQFTALDGEFCEVPWKYVIFRPTCVSPAVAVPPKQGNDVNKNPLMTGNVINIVNG